MPNILSELNMQEFHNQQHLFDLLHQGAMVLTPNNRLCAALLNDYFYYCKQRTIPKPQCLPYRQFINHIFEQQRYHYPEQSYPYLVTEMQCTHLWRTIIQSDKEINYSEGLLRTVMDAWKQCEQWLINPNDQSFYYTHQTQTFQHWWQKFRQKLKQLEAISEYQLVPYLLQNNIPLVSNTFIWASFDEFTPQQLKLQKQLEAQEIPQYIYDLNDNKIISTHLFAAENNQEEYQQLILWIQKHLQTKKDHSPKIGIVVPELQKESAMLQRMLSEHIDPTLFNISLGQKLSEFPLVAHALSWLNLNTSRCSHAQISLLLQSPYIGHAKKEFLQRAHYQQEGHLLKQHYCTYTALILQLEHNTPQLANLLKKIKPYPESASPHEWVLIFQERLNILAFPGDVGLNSEQYQCYARLNILFDEFRQLTLLSKQLNKHEAVGTVTQLAEHTVFQPQKKPAPIQILGLLEASGCTFDYLWVMGLTDQCLPGSTKRSAFIPPILQHTLKMPHNHADRELYFAKNTLHRLRYGSLQSVFSYSKLHGDTPNLPCSLITHFPDYPKCINASQINQEPDREEFTESYEVPLLPDEQLAGGTALLGNQAKCPFKAFAEHRLQAKKVPQITEGLDNKIRGTIIHKIMELLWRTLRSQHNLIQLKESTLDELIDQCINQTLTSEQKIETLIYNIEFTRLKRLALNCLTWEKQRPSFTIRALEQAYTINLAGLEIKIRVDRLDEVEGKQWVIDYKSSIPNAKPWNEDRPQEPQLLLYALLNEQINALLLLQIKTGSILCSGLSESPTHLKGLYSLKKEESWNQLRDTWQQQLNSLAKEILNGYCPPQPINQTTCTYCDFKSLCRI